MSFKDILITAKLSGQKIKSVSEWQELLKPINTFNFNDRLPYPACRRAHCRVIHWSSDYFHSSNSTVPHSMIEIVDLPCNTRDKLIFFFLGKQIHNIIEYTIVTLCVATIGLFSAIIGLKHQHVNARNTCTVGERLRAFSLRLLILKRTAFVQTITFPYKYTLMIYFLASFERQSLSLYWKDAFTISLEAFSPVTCFPGYRFNKPNGQRSNLICRILNILVLFYNIVTKSILTLSFFILLYALPAAHIQVNLDLDSLPRTRNTHYKPEDQLELFHSPLSQQILQFSVSRD